MTPEVIEKKIEKLAYKIKDTYAFKDVFDVKAVLKSSVFENLNISASEMSSITFRIIEKPMTLSITTTVISSGHLAQKFTFKFSFLKGCDQNESKNLYS